MTAAEQLTVVYRGQLELERSRVDFILNSAALVARHLDFVHLSPGIGSDAAELDVFAQRHPVIRNATRIEASSKDLIPARRALRRSLSPDTNCLVAVGFSAGPFVAGLPVATWCINGIPEERLLTRDTWFDRLAVRTSWLGARSVRARGIVAVSEPMSRLIAARLGGPSVVVPNAVDRAAYRPGPQPRTYLTYQGGGSPWQGLDRLAQLWGGLHEVDPGLRFRVVSRDPRTRVLGRSLPTEVIEFTSADTAEGVNELLGEARLGFLYRPPSIVNEVSWPMKYGEYLAAGVPVLVSNCGWDLASHVMEHRAGLCVDWDAPTATAAQEIANFLRVSSDVVSRGVLSAAEGLASSRWEGVLAEALASALKRKDS